MVHSRSETNLDRIFFDLCTSPEVRTKHGHVRNNRRQNLPPLPCLQPIKSTSCSDLSKIPSPRVFQSSSSFDNNQTDAMNLTSSPQLPPLGPRKSIGNTISTPVPLMPIESTGFIVQTPLYFTNRSVSLFETTTTADTKKPTFHIKTTSLQNHSSNNETSKHTSLPPTPLTVSNSWKQQDYTNRLSDRLKSRGHLRKFFLS
jgi:hypothetical protein